MRRLADCRYAGQGYEVRFDVPPGAIDDALAARELGERFHQAHEAEYGHRFEATIEIINIRVVAIGHDRRACRPERLERGDGDPSRALTLEREVIFDVDGQPDRRTDAVLRARAPARAAIASPVRRSSSSTTRRRSCPPGLLAEIDRHGNIVIDCTARAAASSRPARPGCRRRS